jgi:hypothetical protein
VPLFVIDHGATPAPAGPLATFTATNDVQAFSVYDAAAAPPGAKPWAALQLSPAQPETAGSLFVVEERFDPPVALDQAAPQNDQLSPCLQIYGVGWVTSFLAADGTQCRCVYGAADAEAVRSAYRSAGMPFVRVWRARRG